MSYRFYGTFLIHGPFLPMLRKLEKNRYDFTYIIDIDAHLSLDLITSHKVFLSVEHNEYWSWMNNVELASLSFEFNFSNSLCG